MQPHDAIEIRVIGSHRLWIRFADGVSGEVDLSRRLRFKGVFEPLLDPAEFARVAVNAEAGCLEWPNGADIDPDVLYWWVTGIKTFEGDVP